LCCHDEASYSFAGNRFQKLLLAFCMQVQTSVVPPLTFLKAPTRRQGPGALPAQYQKLLRSDIAILAGCRAEVVSPRVLAVKRGSIWRRRWSRLRAAWRVSDNHNQTHMNALAHHHS
jgi:hypothetical protein